MEIQEPKVGSKFKKNLLFTLLIIYFLFLSAFLYNLYRSYLFFIKMGTKGSFFSFELLYWPVLVFGVLGLVYFVLISFRYLSQRNFLIKTTTSRGNNYLLLSFIVLFVLLLAVPVELPGMTGGAPLAIVYFILFLGGSFFGVSIPVPYLMLVIVLVGHVVAAYLIVALLSYFFNKLRPKSNTKTEEINSNSR